MTQTTPPPSHVLSLSGGLDSTVLCALLREKHGPASVLPVFFIYGSKHNMRELAAAEAVAAHYGLKLRSIDLTAVFSHVQSGLLAGDERALPGCAYSKESMRLTVVPGRNLIFASVLAALAESSGAAAVALATHGGDHHLYPDCRPEFNAALNAVVQQSSGSAVRVETPFAHMDKKAIVTEGIRLGVPFQLTRSCYSSGEASCGTCGTCVERLEAFAANGMQDPVAYQKA